MALSRHPTWLLPAMLVPAGVALPAAATQYLSIEQAQKALLPEAAAFEPADVVIGAALKERIEQASGVRVRTPLLKVWRARKDGKLLGWFVLDEVIGKHEYITYAVALTPEGVVQGVEILDYRETHGGEIRNAQWRAQFVGKKNGDALRLDDDIRNISGATLSCKNVTNGVKRILASYQLALR